MDILAKTSTQIFNEKVGLIYEYNKKSPLFVRMANTEIENNNLERAIEILDEGLKYFPDYATAHLLLGRALMLTGNYSKALKSVQTGSELISSKKTYEHYLKEIELVKKQRSLFQTTRRTAFYNDETEVVKDEPDLFQSEKEKTVKPAELKPETKETSLEDRLNQIANKINQAKIQEKEEFSPSESMFDSYSGDHLIVSETLAKIYIAQGEYLEAMRVYEKLKIKEPDRSSYFDQKIEELKRESEY